jgi:uncharacterized coiled-coil DUF342 family protein
MKTTDDLCERINASYRTIRAMTDEIATLIWERDELRKQIQLYEKHGVTCQTYRHKVESSCSECNVQENYAKRTT